jgi:hypothetical protein
MTRATTSHSLASAPARLHLDIYLQIVGKKQDQTAGFAYYAKKNKMGPRTKAEWDEAWEKFNNRPV